MQLLFSMNANFNLLNLSRKIYEAFVVLPYLKKNATNEGRRSLNSWAVSNRPKKDQTFLGFILIQLDASLVLYEC